MTVSDDDGNADTQIAHRGTQDDGGQLCRIRCRLETAVALYILQAGI